MESLKVCMANYTKTPKPCNFQNTQVFWIGANPSLANIPRDFFEFLAVMSSSIPLSEFRNSGSGFLSGLPIFPEIPEIWVPVYLWVSERRLKKMLLLETTVYSSSPHHFSRTSLNGQTLEILFCNWSFLLCWQ